MVRKVGVAWAHRYLWSSPFTILQVPSAPLYVLSPRPSQSPSCVPQAPLAPPCPPGPLVPHPQAVSCPQQAPRPPKPGFTRSTKGSSLWSKEPRGAWWEEGPWSRPVRPSSSFLYFCDPRTFLPV